MEELSKEEYELWLEHPVTQRVHKFLEIRREDMLEKYLGCTPAVETIGILNYLNGIREAFKTVLEPDLYDDINIVETRDDPKSSV